MDSEKGTGSNVIRVKLLKQKKYGLGFLVRKRSRAPHVVVSDLVANGMAAESGLVQIGDVILKVNDIDFEHLVYEKSVDVLKSLAVNVPVVLILKGPEGYTSYLETRFAADGTPRTIRITKPVVHTDSFIGRIRKTLSAGPSRSCRTKQTQANCECHSKGSGQCDDTKPALVNGDIHYDISRSNIPDTDGRAADTVTIKADGDPDSAIRGVVHNNNDKNTLKAEPGYQDSVNATVINNGVVVTCADMPVHPDGTNGINSKNQVIINSTSTHDTNNDKNSISDSNKQNSKMLTNGCEQNGQLKSGQSLLNGSPKLSNAGSRRGSDDLGKLKKGLEVETALERATTASGKCSPVKKFVKLRHVGEERPVCTDTLHTKAIEVRKLFCFIFCFFGLLDDLMFLIDYASPNIVILVPWQVPY